MNSGQLVVSQGQIHNSRANFASMCGLVPVSLHMPSSLPRRVTCSSAPSSLPTELVYPRVNKSQKLSWGKHSFSHAHYQNPDRISEFISSRKQ